MPTTKPRLQITLRSPTYLLLGRVAKLRRTSRAAVVSEFVEEIAPVLQRVETVLTKAREAGDWAKQWRADAEEVQRRLEDAASINLDLFERIGTGIGSAVGASGPTPEPVTRGSESAKSLKRHKTHRRRRP